MASGIFLLTAFYYNLQCPLMYRLNTCADMEMPRKDLLNAVEFNLSRTELRLVAHSVSTLSFAGDDKKGTFVIGILSSADNVCLRESQRKLFLPRAKVYKRLDIKVFFLLDERSPALNLELKINRDIVFLNTSLHGWGRGFARKLHIWLNYVIANFPDAVLIGRMDDDVFACTPQIFDRLYDVQHKLLYYGYPTGYPRQCTIDCVDEMFLIIGIELAKRVANRAFCVDHKKQENNCLIDGNGGHKFRRWIDIYKDYIFVDEKANKKMIWYFKASKNHSEYKKYMTPMFCEKFLLYHKANPSEMYRWTQYNSLLLNDNILANISEYDIVNADNCSRYDKEARQ